jgi:hypothetical protein
MGSVQTGLLAPKLYMLTRRTPNNAKPRIMSIASMRCPGSTGPSPAMGGLVTDASVGLVTWALILSEKYGAKIELQLVCRQRLPQLFANSNPILSALAKSAWAAAARRFRC